MILLRRTLILGFALAVAGCALVREVEPDAAGIPAGPLEAFGDDAVGPVVEVGSGRTFGVGWRYSIYQSQNGWCTQLETATASSSSCGPMAPEDGVFNGVGVGGGSDGAATLEGIVSPEVAAVWIETATGARIETTLMSLAAAGMDAKAFVGFAPENDQVDSLTALDADGNVLETLNLTNLP